MIFVIYNNFENIFYGFLYLKKIINIDLNINKYKLIIIYLFLQ